MNITQLKKAFPLIIQTDLTPILVGQHGTGKSQVIRQLAAANDAGMVELRLGQMEVGDLIGLAEFVRDAKGNPLSTRFIKPDYLPTSGKGIFFLDEINRATKDLHQATFQLILDKRLHQYMLPKATFDKDGNWLDGWVVVAAMNPSTEDYVVTDMSDSAYTDRFCYIKYEPTVAEWLEYASSQKVSSTLVSLITKQPKLLDGKTVDFALENIHPSRRSWMELDRVVKLTQDKEIIQEIAKGVIGIEATVLYMKELENKLDTIDVEASYKDFTKFKPQLQQLLNDERHDLVNQFLTGVVELKKDKKVTKKDCDKFRDITAMLPKDRAFSFFMDILQKMENLHDFIIEDAEFQKVAQGLDLANEAK